MDLKKLNELNLALINKKKFPIVKILKNLPKSSSLFETILVTSNDEFVDLFLKKKIKFNQISDHIMKFIKNKEFQKYKRIRPKNIHEIVELSKYVRLKISSLSI